MFAVLFFDDFSFNISSDSDPFIFRLIWLRTSSWLRTHMYWDDGLSKTEEKRLRKWIDFMTRQALLYRSITLISIPDQRFFVAIRRFLETGLYLIVQFLMTLFSILFLFYLCLDTWSTSSLICAMKLYIFVFRSLKFDRVKSKWKESATDANAVSHGHPTDGFLLNTLITLFRQSRVLLDV